MSRRESVPFDTDTAIKGIDVSHHNQDIHWDKVVKAGNKFVYVRTGDGRTWDKRWLENAQGAREAGLSLGYYHYFRADRGGTKQARMIKEASLSVPPDLPPVLDIEHGAWRNFPGGVFDTAGNLSTLAVWSTIKTFRKYHPDAIIYGGAALHWRITKTDYKFEKSTRYWCGGAIGMRKPMMPLHSDDSWAFYNIDIWQYKVEDPSDLCGSERMDLNYMTKECWDSLPRTKKPAHNCKKALEKLSEIEESIKELRSLLQK